MARRYSGQLTINVLYDDHGFYRTTVSGPNGSWRGNVYPPAAGLGRGVAYDSAQAYDEVARAAVSFADDEMRGMGDYAEWDDDGPRVRRAKLRRNPRRRR